MYLNFKLYDFCSQANVKEVCTFLLKVKYTCVQVIVCESLLSIVTLERRGLSV